jgi:hypothetical protein
MRVETNPGVILAAVAQIRSGACLAGFLPAWLWWLP